MRFAIVQSGVVTNVAVADEALDATWIQSDTAGIGDTYADGVFTPSTAVEIPQIVTMSQARKALRRSGITSTNVEAAIANISDQTEREDAQDDWEYSTTVSRTSSLVNSLGVALGLNDESIDNLFILASTL